MAERSIKVNSLRELVDELIRSGRRLIGPREREGRFYFEELSSPDELALSYGNTELSYKEFLFPRTETLFGYSASKGETEIHGPDGSPPETVIIGGRPCDAASLPIIDKVFFWDYVDSSYAERRNATTVISISCTEPADSATCFCTSVGLGPDSPRGSDVLMTPLEDGFFFVESASEAGEKFLEDFSRFFDDAGPELRRMREDVGRAASDLISRKIDMDVVRGWLEANFDDEIWEVISEQCLQCGVCAFVCPTCHCFDIVDEEDGVGVGRRCKNWDACTFYHFTLQAGGLNPRDRQYKRYRQRIMHKFSYYAERFGEILCTGCGRCSRACPVNLDIASVLERIELAAS